MRGEAMIKRQLLRFAQFALFAVEPTVIKQNKRKNWTSKPCMKHEFHTAPYENVHPERLC